MTHRDAPGPLIDGMIGIMLVLTATVTMLFSAYLALRVANFAWCLFGRVCSSGCVL